MDSSDVDGGNDDESKRTLSLILIVINSFPWSFTVSYPFLFNTLSILLLFLEEKAWL